MGWTVYGARQRRTIPSRMTGTGLTSYHGTTPDSLVSVLRCGFVPAGCPTCHNVPRMRGVKNGTVGDDVVPDPIYLSPRLSYASCYAVPFMDPSGQYLCQVVLEVKCYKDPAKLLPSTLPHLWRSESLGPFSREAVNENLEWIFPASDLSHIEIVSVLIRCTSLSTFQQNHTLRVIPLKSFDNGKLKAVMFHLLYRHRAACACRKLISNVSILQCCVTSQHATTWALKGKHEDGKDVTIKDVPEDCFIHTTSIGEEGKQGINLAVCLAQTNNNFAVCDNCPPKHNPKIKSEKQTKDSGCTICKNLFCYIAYDDANGAFICRKDCLYTL